MKKIDIKIDTGTSYRLNELIDFQGDLKELTAENLDRLKSRIVSLGFTVPFFVWENEGVAHILDGHQRKIALTSLIADGWNVPALPAVVIPADSVEDAKEILLTITSQYGEFNVDTLKKWCEDLDGAVSETMRFVSNEITFDLDMSLDFEDEQPSEVDHENINECPECGCKFK